MTTACETDATCEAEADNEEKVPNLVCRCTVRQSDASCVVCRCAKKPCCELTDADDTRVAPMRNLLDQPSTSRRGCSISPTWECAPQCATQDMFETLDILDEEIDADNFFNQNTGPGRPSLRGVVQMVRSHESDNCVGLPLRGAVIGPGADVEICKQVNFRPCAGLFLGQAEPQSAASGGLSQYGAPSPGPWVFELPQNEARFLVEQALSPRIDGSSGPSRPKINFGGRVTPPFRVSSGNRNAILGVLGAVRSRGDADEYVDVSYTMRERSGTYFWGTEKDLDYDTQVALFA